MRPHPTRMRPDRRAGSRPPGGFTLLEILVVVLIVTLLSAATLPAVLPALNSRRVSEGSRILQSEFARARDAAVRSGAPHGFRLIPDPNPDILTVDPLTGTTVTGGMSSRKLTASRLVALEVPPDYSEGMLYLGFGVDATASAPGTTVPPGYTSDASYPFGPLPYQQAPSAMVGFTTAREVDTYLRVVEVKFDTVSGVSVPANPTSWYWNLRQGDKLRLHDSGQYYTVAGPVLISGNLNPERFINYGQPANYQTGPGATNAEFLYLLNNHDDDGDGYIDEQFDGIDNDGDGIVDPGFNGLDDNGDGNFDEVQEMFLHRLADGSFTYPGFNGPLTGIENFSNEFEPEIFVGKTGTAPGYGPPITYPVALSYTVQRRPVPTSSSREVALPTNVVIDLTGSLTADFGRPNPLSERSRVPIDPKTGYVDILVAPNGSILASAAGTNLAPSVDFPFYHFWFTERDDVYEPTNYGVNYPFTQPMLRDTGGDPRIGTLAYPDTAPALKGERRLLTVNTRTGQITSTAVEVFYANNTSYPFEAAEAGVKDAQP